MPRALITGGLGAIGAATARRLARDGWVADLVDLADDATPAQAEMVASIGATYTRLDVTDHDAVAAYLDASAPLDAVIGVAGVGDTAPFLEQTMTGWRRVFEINLVANMFLTQQAAKRWIAADSGGSVVLVTSWIDQRPWPGTAAYSAAKAALSQMARSAALELAPYGIKVNVIAPGVLGEGMAGEEAKRDPEYARRIATSVPLGRLQTADDVAEGIAFLVGPGGQYMTGARLVMDGGTTLVSGAGVMGRS
jgi:NAD(P)-dependent dehydrogenase (short-subunit alcohol dehydrogenase family)